MIAVASCANSPGAYPLGPYGIDVGTTLQNASLADADGHAVTLGDLRAQHPVVLLYLAAPWCFTCGPEVAWLNAQRTARPALGSYVVVLQNQDFARPSPADAVAFGTTYHAVVPVLADVEQMLTARLPIDAIPFNIIVRTDRMEIMHRSLGFDAALLGAAVDAALAAL